MLAGFFPRNPNLQDDGALFDKQNKCVIVFEDVKHYL